MASGAWDALITDGPVDNIFGSLKLAKAIQAGGGMIGKVSADGGKTFECTLEYATNSTARAYGELESLDASRGDVFTAATYNQKLHAAQVVFSDWEQAVTRGENAKFDYVDKKLTNGKNSHLNDLNGALYGDGSAYGGNAIDGLQKLIPNDPTVGVVGSIDPATWVFWRTQQASGTKTSAAGDNINSSWTSVFDSCSRGGSEDAPTDVITDKASFELYVAQAQTFQRFNKDGKSARGMNLGWDNDAIEFKSASVHYDEAAAVFTPGNAYFINGKFLQFAYLKGAWMKLKPANELPNQLATVYNVYTIGQLCSPNRRRLGVVTNIT